MTNFRAHGVDVDYLPLDRRARIRELDIVANKGEIICLYGRSGSGKSSVLRHVVGVDEHKQGLVQLLGEELTKVEPRRRAEIRRLVMTYVDQDAELVADLTVLDNVLLPMVPDGRAGVSASRPRALHLLDELGIVDQAQNAAHSLSGGERRRVGLARALMPAPAMLVLDEPTAGLDEHWAQKVVEILRGVAGRGGIVLTASHDPLMIESSSRTIEVS